MRPTSYRDAFFSPRRFSSDKWEHYFEVYDLLLGRYYGAERTNYLEIGVQGGGSLEVAGMLLGPGSKICGLDLDPACAALQQAGIADRVFIGSQIDPNLLRTVVTDAGPFDIVIDDGSHVQGHMITTFVNLFPALRQGGVYIIEDTHTNYFPTHQESFYGIGLYDYFKGLAERLNIDFMDPALRSTRYKLPREQRPPRAIADDLCRDIFSIQFFDSVIGIIKRRRAEPLRLRR